MKTNRKVILNIIQDQIIAQRLFVKVAEILRVFNPQSDVENDFEAEIKYKGFNTALLLLEVNIDLDLDDKLSDSFWNLFYSNPEEDAVKLAQLIYVEWLELIRLHYVSISKTAA